MNSFTDHFRHEIERFLERTGFKPTELGFQAVADRAFVLNLRRGRSPTLATADRLLAFMRDYEAQNERKRKNKQSSIHE